MKSSTPKLLGIVIALQVMLLIGQWVNPSASTAMAQVSNPSERQYAMIDELKSLNSKVDRLISLLQSGNVEVKVAKTDAKK
jgi:hypothetical protein